MAQLPRGIAPDLLVSQVKNTMPYLFDADSESALGRFPPARVLRAFESESPASLTHFEYFRLCLSAHYSSCGTPVPTDVDNQIRQKLWPRQLPLETALEMADLVLESRRWDFRAVTTRYTYGAKATPWEKETLSGHLGEWFTVSCGAYCALGQYSAPEAERKRQEIFSEIRDEVHRHSEIFGSLWRAGEGINALKASASIAHNLGDLDRVMDMWELNVADPLRTEFYKLGAQPFDASGKLRHLGRLWTAGELYKSPIDESAMAFENHRHFALRKPKSLRRSPSFLIPTAPFFDDWGATVARELAGEGGRASGDTLEVAEALKDGWRKLNRTVGYGRALHGMLSVHEDLPIQELRKDRVFRQVLERSQVAFEKRWNEEALRLLDEIPSRA